MMEINGQIGPAIEAFPVGRPSADAANAAGRGGAGAEGVPAADRYISSDGQGADGGIYTLKDLLDKKAQAGSSPDEDGMDWRMNESDSDEKKSKGPNELDEGDKELVKRLQARDTEVRMHEQAHAAAAGKYAEGAPTYSYQRGPDGKMYAIGGSLALDVGREATAAENNSKSAILRAAALGVAEPSAADAMVAAQVGRLMGQGVNVQA